MQELKDDMLERTNQMRSSCLAMESTGIQTLVALADQGEQLNDLDSRLTSIDTTLNDTKQNINRLKGLTQRVVDSFRTKFHRKFFSKVMVHSTSKQNSIQSSSPRRRQSSSSTPKVIEHRNHPIKSFTDDKIDETLCDIEGVLHRLKSIAQDMNDQLVGQTDTIYRIHEHMKDATVHVEEQNSDLLKMIP